MDEQTQQPLHTLKDAVQFGSKQLTTRSPSAQLDTLILIGLVFQKTKEQIFTALDSPLEADKIERYRDLIQRRKEGYPIAYLTNYKEFYGLPIYVEEGILCPRPESEILVETVLNLIKKSKNPTPRLLDVATGSGALGIAIKNTLFKVELSASDVSPTAQKVFARNCEQILQQSCPFYLGSLLEPLAQDPALQPFDFIISNPPYLTTQETDERIHQLHWKEPALALDGGSDGLDLIRTLIVQAASHLKSGGYFVLEAAPAQMKTIAELMKTHFNEISLIKDLAGDDRIIYGQK